MPNERGNRGLLSNFRRGGTNSEHHHNGESSSDPSSSSSYLPDPSALLKDLAPNLLSSSSRILHPSNLHAHQQALASSAAASATDPSTIESLRRKLSFLRTGLSIESSARRGGGASSNATSWGQLGQELYIRDRVDELLRLPIPASPFPFASSPTTTASAVLSIEAPPPRADDPVPLIQGFQATIPASNQARLERRRRRAIESEQRLGLKQGSRLGLKERGDRARGLLGDVPEEVTRGDDDDETLRIGRNSSKRIENDASAAAKATTTGGTGPSRTELEGDLKAISKDMSNVAVRRALLNSQIRDVESKIKELEIIRDGFRKNLLGLREEELELQDEREYHSASHTLPPATRISTTTHISTDIDSRRDRNVFGEVTPRVDGLACFLGRLVFVTRERRCPRWLECESTADDELI